MSRPDAMAGAPNQGLRYHEIGSNRTKESPTDGELTDERIVKKALYVFLARAALPGREMATEAGQVSKNPRRYVVSCSNGSAKLTLTAN